MLRLKHQLMFELTKVLAQTDFVSCANWDGWSMGRFPQFGFNLTGVLKKGPAGQINVLQPQ